ncbi:hypothetical protein SAMN05192533_10865 [Mesobacillus persicus]|uniref:Uncharacterized protein n=1 Tax=Mesobacillus persicus TaxID=930146 RepID=A0A1H8D519_9BACI|nr:hypothetical protein SAMN05192533_10865 [Mesobacillus persicus]
MQRIDIIESTQIFILITGAIYLLIVGLTEIVLSGHLLMLMITLMTFFRGVEAYKKGKIIISRIIIIISFIFLSLLLFITFF